MSNTVRPRPPRTHRRSAPSTGHQDPAKAYRPSPRHTLLGKLKDRIEVPAFRFRLPDGTRTDQSPWVWRGLFFFALIAFGICLMLISGGKSGYAAAWAVIGSGWFVLSMWRWRRHIQHHRG